MEWNDLRVVMAVAQEGTLSGAARRLRVTHSTVFRRLAVIEKDLGVRLFERFRDGYSVTAAGDAAAALAARFADEFLALERRLSGQDLRPSGVVRITTTDTICPILMRHAPALRATHPEISLEITVSNAMANLTRREADIAVRPIAAAPETLIGRRIADIAYAIYGSPSYLSRHRDGDQSNFAWVGLDDSLAMTAIGRWMAENVPDRQMAVRVDALPALRDAACAGIGTVLLPCYLGDAETRLRRVPMAEGPDAHSALWLLTHSDLRRTARIRAVMDFLAAALSAERPLFEGRRYGKAPTRIVGPVSRNRKARRPRKCTLARTR